MNTDEKLKNFLKEKELIIISISIIIIVLLTGLFIKSQRNTFASYSKQDYFDVNKSIYTNHLDHAKQFRSVLLSDKKVDQLINKTATIELKKSKFVKVIVRMLKNKYALLTLFPFLSAIVAILTFLIIPTGWSSSSNYLKSFFILFTTLTALAGVFPQVYNQTEGIKQNLGSFKQLNIIQENIFSYIETAPYSFKTNIEFDKFLDSINTVIVKVPDVYFEIEKHNFEADLFKSMNGN